MFLFSREEFIEMAKGKKTYRMASFYQKLEKNSIFLLMKLEIQLVVNGLLTKITEKNTKKC